MGPSGTPSAEESQFGWLLSGPIKSVAASMNRFSPSGCDHPSSLHVSGDITRLEKSLEKFWETEEPEVLKHPRSRVDEICESIFQSTTKRDADGRYVVSQPFRQTHPTLRASLSTAVKRFSSVEKRMLSNPLIKNEYKRYFEEHLAAGIMEVIPEGEIQIAESQCYYMPYHEVLKETSTTTKVHIVYDCSANTTHGPSLNELLLPGPKLQVNLISLLINFRAYPVAISADISKFFNQIEVSSEHQDFQRLVFREDSHLPLKHYRMKRLTFGLTPAPFWASRTLHQLFDDECVDADVIQIVKMETLVDNVLTGAFTVPRGLAIQQQLLRTMSKGKMELRKWASNVHALLEAVPQNDREINLPLEITENHELPTLGVKWNPSVDTFQLSIPKFDVDPRATKKYVLSVIALICDPLGWLSPVTIRPKMFLQELWKEKFDWDTPLPIPLILKWNCILNDLRVLDQFKMNRCYYATTDWDFVNGNTQAYHLCGFSDASNYAYSAVVYLRCVDANGHVSVSLIGAKTKVAPIKGETTPRLELNGARLLSGFMKTVQDSLPLKIESVSCFSDSTSVLGQINPSSKEKKDVYVTNRVRTIHQNLPNASWYHIAGEENPADCASRGISAADFLQHPLWLNRPRCVMNPEFSRASLHTTAVSSEPSASVICEIVAKVSSFSKLIRVVAYVLRFVRNLKGPSKTTGNPSTVELHSALEVVVKAVQTQVFSEEAKAIRRSSLPKQFKFLTPFFDEQGIIRVGGRIHNASVSDDMAHPILLPKKHHLSMIIARYFHVTHLHPGPNLLLSLIRGKFWIIGGLNLAKRVVRACIICHRANPTPLTQIMSNLPIPRVTLSRPFSSTAMDFAGRSPLP